jgi:REP element-mobilizing transposase RayT
MSHDSKRYNRRSIRLKEYDYSNPGAYFITICTHNRKLYFEKYKKLKEIVNLEWLKIPNRYPNVQLDEFIIMPNHIHGILMIVGATLAVAQNKRAGARPAPTIDEIIGTFKSLCVNEWLKDIKENRINVAGKFWQRNYYEHIVRDENSLNRIREYIMNNPLRWHLDKENPNKIGEDEFDLWIEREFKKRPKSGLN